MSTAMALRRTAGVSFAQCSVMSCPVRLFRLSPRALMNPPASAGGGVRIAQGEDGEAEQPGEIVREELVECTFIAAEHAPYQFALAAVLHLDQLEGLTLADPSISTDLDPTGRE